VTDTPTERDNEGAWATLRRRKVVQWGIAYAAAAWTLLQVLEYFGETYAWPRAVRQISGLALPLSLLFVLVLAWYHGDKGDQRVSRPELAILATLVAFVGGTLWWYVSRIDESAWVIDTGVLSTRHALPPDAASIAVLPFVNMSSDKEQEYFSDGLSEELLNLLAQVPELRVIARTSSFSFKGREVDVATIARTLNVANVLEGSVRKSGDTLRITAQLVRTSDSSHLWSQTYDRRMTDVFKVQDEIAAAVVDQLKIQLLGDAPRARATDPKAYAFYLQARAIGRQNTAAAYERSIALYQQALTLDPAYTAAWVGLAGAYCDEVNEGLRLNDEGIRLAREATDKALALDRRFGPAYAQLGWIALYYDRDLQAAARHLGHALALEPANPDIIGTAAVLARRLGLLDKAIAIGQYQIARDPVNSDGHHRLGLAYRYAGRLDEAIAEFRTTLALSPDATGTHLVLGEILLQKGDADAALVEIQKEPLEARRLGSLSMVYHALGRQAESDAVLAELIRKYEKTSADFIAIALAYRGEADLAFKWLDKAVRYHDTNLGSIAVYPMIANLHNDPRWLPFLRNLGMAPEQLAAIKFDVTLPK